MDSASSIFDTVKKQMGIDADYHILDSQIITQINIVLSDLNHLGVGPSEVFSITDSTTTWHDFIGDSDTLESVSSYLITQVEKSFTPFDLETEPDTSNRILGTIKKMLGIGTDNSFDTDVIADINSTLLALNQMGVGPTDVFSITGESEVWADFFANAINLEAVKSYVYIKTKMVFDPPASSTVLDALTRQADDLAWRLTAQAEPILVVVPDLQEEGDWCHEIE
jgi:hypothetical protein